MCERLEVTQTVEPIGSAGDIVEVVNRAMEALQPKPAYPANDKQLVFNELATVLKFFRGLREGS